MALCVGQYATVPANAQCLDDQLVQDGSRPRTASLLS
jgi:hypothetical protein